MNINQTRSRPENIMLFIDMNSFFASCEQDYNYYLRGRPIGVCVYPSRTGFIISPSIEAKKMGVKMGMRLDEAIRVCPELIPVETHPQRYREYHIKIINVLKRYSDEVLPKSIDEAVVDISNYKLVYKDPVVLAKKIKEDIQKDVGEWLKCSIGIAPNAFLAKLASDIQKPDGLVQITPENIDKVLGRLKLNDLPGIAEGMSHRLIKGGITTPLELRHATPEYLRTVCNSIVGVYWHMRLNFSEVDMASQEYKTMQAVRQLSRDQREKPRYVNDLLQELCMKLERRMVGQGVYCRSVAVNVGYENGAGWKDQVKSTRPIQDGMEMLEFIKKRIKRYENERGGGTLLHSGVTSIGVSVHDFVSDELLQVDMFEDNLRKDALRKTLYDIKNRFGTDKVMKAAEMHDERILEDVIGFGSIKDLH